MFRAAIPITFGFLSLGTLVLLVLSIESNLSPESLQRAVIPAALAMMIWSASKFLRTTLTASINEFLKARDDFDRHW